MIKSKPVCGNRDRRIGQGACNLMGPPLLSRGRNRNSIQPRPHPLKITFAPAKVYNLPRQMIFPRKQIFPRKEPFPSKGLFPHAVQSYNSNGLPRREVVRPGLAMLHRLRVPKTRKNSATKVTKRRIIAKACSPVMGFECHRKREPTLPRNIFRETKPNRILPERCRCTTKVGLQ
jgi:hypothetical protein